MNINKIILKEVLENLTNKEALRKALERNEILTSTYCLADCTCTVYKEGFYFQLEGARANYNVFVLDNDGELEVTRKPHKEKLNKIYTCSFKMNESDYINI